MAYVKISDFEQNQEKTTLGARTRFLQNFPAMFLGLSCGIENGAKPIIAFGSVLPSGEDELPLRVEAGGFVRDLLLMLGYTSLSSLVRSEEFLAANAGRDDFVYITLVETVNRGEASASADVTNRAPSGSAQDDEQADEQPNEQLSTELDARIAELKGLMDGVTPASHIEKPLSPREYMLRHLLHLEFAAAEVSGGLVGLGVVKDGVTRTFIGGEDPDEFSDQLAKALGFENKDAALSSEEGAVVIRAEIEKSFESLMKIALEKMRSERTGSAEPNGMPGPGLPNERTLEDEVGGPPAKEHLI